jgi:4'-phosphopantetheinyl transferase
MTAAGVWLAPVGTLEVQKGEVHVWRMPLPVDATGVAAFRGVLSAAEHARANHFRSQRHRDAFIVAHATMRTILARYVRRAPEELTFTEGRFGKPALESA